MTAPTTYRGWTIHYEPDSLVHGQEWHANSPDFDASYEGPEYGWVGGHQVTAGTWVELIAEIDAAIEELEDAA